MTLLRRIAGKFRSTARAILARPEPRMRWGVSSSPRVALLDVTRDLHLQYEQLRARGSVHYLEDHRAWLVLDYADVQMIISQHETFSNSAYREVDSVLLAADPPAHGVMRRVAARFFSAEALHRLSLDAAVLAPQLLRPSMDIVADYAVPIVQHVAAGLLGLDAAGVADIRKAQAAAPEIDAFGPALDRISSRAALYPGLLQEGLTEEQARSLLRLLWLAAVTTSERVISRCIYRLLQHDELRSRLLAQPEQIPAFVEEVIRLHPPELLVPRIALRDTEVAGVQIPSGALVHACLAAANRDPEVFIRPNEIWLERPKSPRHVTFGHGIHQCVGAALARAEVIIAVRTLLERAPGFRAAQDLDTVTQFATLTAQAVTSLRIETGRSEGSVSG